MGMGYGAAYADVVDGTFVQKKARKAYNAFMKLIASTGTDIQEFAKAAQFDDPAEMKEFPATVLTAYYALLKAFKTATKLTLCMGCHNSDDEGDRYDEVEGMFWTVDGVWTLTPAGKKYHKEVERKFFVTFG